MTREHAYKLRDLLHKASASLSDKDALDGIELFAIWDASASYNADDRVRYNEILYRCLQTHQAQEGWTPVDAPSLWAKVLIPDPGIIPEWEQPSSTNPYMTGDKVRHSNKIWISTIDNNVWEPGVYGWDIVE